jgi:alpha-galactosidase
MRITSVAGIIVALPSTFGLDNGLALTPPMGWRSWNCDHIDVSDVKIRATIDAIVSRKRKNHNGEMTSLADVGFGRVGVDDGWQACGTGVRLDHTSFHAWDGTPLINASTFPSLKEMVKYGHAAGVKMGWVRRLSVCALSPRCCLRSLLHDMCTFSRT